MYFLKDRLDNSSSQRQRRSRMASSGPQGPIWRNNPFNRGSMSPSPGARPANTRPKSMVTSPTLATTNVGHARTHSFSPMNSTPAPSRTARQRSSSNRSITPSTNTFAPKFIKAEELQRSDEQTTHIEGENDFSGKRYVWLRDPQSAFVKGWVVEDLNDGHLIVQCEDGSVRLYRECLSYEANPP